MRMSNPSPAPANTSPAYLSAAICTQKHATTHSIDPPTMLTAVSPTATRFDQSGVMRRARNTTANDATPMAPSNRA